MSRISGYSVTNIFLIIYILSVYHGVYLLTRAASCAGEYLLLKYRNFFFRLKFC